MKSNVLRFPQELTTKGTGKGVTQKNNSKNRDDASALMVKMNDMDLMRLREAFDKARLEWPEEEAELPEKNKIHSI